MDTEDCLPRQVLPSSEVLTPDTRRRVEQAWGQVLFNQYAATETGSIAAECEHHMGMHLLEDFLMIEVVDHANRPVPPGVYGEKLLVTVLFNRTQPLIRYEISDSVRLSQAMCPSGRPYRLIDAVQGRMEEVLGSTHSCSINAIMAKAPPNPVMPIHKNTLTRVKNCGCLKLLCAPSFPASMGLSLH